MLWPLGRSQSQARCAIRNLDHRWNVFGGIWIPRDYSLVAKDTLKRDTAFSFFVPFCLHSFTYHGLNSPESRSKGAQEIQFPGTHMTRKMSMNKPRTSLEGFSGPVNLKSELKEVRQ